MTDNITPMRPTDGPPCTKPEDPDHHLLDFIAKWHVERCKAQLHWAEGNAMRRSSESAGWAIGPPGPSFGNQKLTASFDTTNARLG